MDFKTNTSIVSSEERCFKDKQNRHSVIEKPVAISFTTAPVSTASVAITLRGAALSFTEHSLGGMTAMSFRKETHRRTGISELVLSQCPYQFK